MAETRPSPYNGWQSTGPPDPFGPASKRQRLSPNPMSPSMSPMNTTFPTLGMMNNNHQQSSFNTPQPVASPLEMTQRRAGSMGPPSRPLEKEDTRSTDVKSLFDVASGIGLDEKEEENYLLHSYRHSTADVSFNSQSSQTISASNSFDLLSQSRRNGGTLPGFSQLSGSVSAKSPEDELNDKHKAAARSFSENRQLHLMDPFLWGQSVRGRVQRIATEIGIKIPVEGLFDKIPDKQPQPQNVHGTTSNGSHGTILELKAPSILNRGAPLEAILSLISLAANERVRGLLEDAHGLARSRRAGSDGVIPAEWAPIVTSPNRSQQPSQPRSSSAPPPGATQGPRNPISSVLHSLAKADRAAEEAREKKRRARLARKAAQLASTITPGGAAGAAGVAGLEGTDLASPGTPQANGVAPALLPERAPSEVKLTKKERDRLAKADQTDEVLRRNANQTAVSQLGGGKKYSWLTGGGSGKGGGGGSGASTPSRRATAAANGAAGGAGAQGAGKGGGAAGGPRERVFGEWREDGASGRGIQLKDWVGALEMDGHEKKTLAYAFARLDAEKAGALGESAAPAAVSTTPTPAA